MQVNIETLSFADDGMRSDQNRLDYDAEDREITCGPVGRADFSEAAFRLRSRRGVALRRIVQHSCASLQVQGRLFGAKRVT